MVSVIIPTYNRETLVVRSVGSVLTQTYENLELHLIDDGSQDNTKRAVAPFFPDSRFHYHYQPNQGQSVARNLGIEKSKGNLIAFLDSDNYWLPDKLRLQTDFLNQNNGFDILYSSGVVVDENGNRLNRPPVKRHTGKILGQLLQGNFISNNTVLVKRYCFEEMGGFDEGLRVAEDYDLWLRFATRYRFLYHPEEVACYCISGDRLSRDEYRVLMTNFHILYRFFEAFPNSCSTKERRLAWANIYRWSAQIAAKNNRNKALKDMLRSLSYYPWNVKNWRTLARIIFSGQRKVSR